MAEATHTANRDLPAFAAQASSFCFTCKAHRQGIPPSCPSFHQLRPLPPASRRAVPEGPTLPGLDLQVSGEGGAADGFGAILHPQ